MKKNKSKRFKKLVETNKDRKLMLLEDALKKVKINCTTKFDESIDVSLNLNLKQKKEELTLRTVVNLPNGNGKKIKVAVLCEDAKIDEAKKAGAELAGSDNLVEDITAGKINFDKLCLPYLDSYANFLTIKTGSRTSDIYNKLLSEGIILRPLNNYGLPRYLRVTIGSESENRYFIDKLTRIVEFTK